MWYVVEMIISKPVIPNFYTDPVIFETNPGSFYYFYSKDFEFEDNGTPKLGRIILDYNKAFTQRYISPIPEFVDLKIKVTYETNNREKKQGFGETNVIYLDITPSIE